MMHCSKPITYTCTLEPGHDGECGENGRKERLETSTSEGKPKPKHGKRTASWVYGAINPIADSLFWEIKNLRNKLSDGDGRPSNIPACKDYVNPSLRPIVMDFLQHHPGAKAAVTERDWVAEKYREGKAGPSAVVDADEKLIDVLMDVSQELREKHNLPAVPWEQFCAKDNDL